MLVILSGAHHYFSFWSDMILTGSFANIEAWWFKSLQTPNTSRLWNLNFTLFLICPSWYCTAQRSTHIEYDVFCPRSMKIALYNGSSYVHSPEDYEVYHNKRRVGVVFLRASAQLIKKVLWLESHSEWPSMGTFLKYLLGTNSVVWIRSGLSSSPKKYISVIELPRYLWNYHRNLFALWQTVIFLHILSFQISLKETRLRLSLSSFHTHYFVVIVFSGWRAQFRSNFAEVTVLFSWRFLFFLRK